MNPMASTRSRWPCLLGAALLLAAGPVLADNLTLVEALYSAVDHDPTVPGSRARYDADIEAGEQERSTLRPSLSAQAAYNYTYSDSQFAFGTSRDEYPALSAGVEARQALFRLDWSARGERAEARDALAEAALERRRIGLFGRVAGRYFAVLIAQDGLQQAEAEARAVRESLGDTRKRYEVDLVPGTDLKEAQARDDLAQAQLISARQALASAQDELAESVGTHDYRMPTLPETVVFPPIMPAEVESWIDTALDNNPDLVIARHDAEVARTLVRSRRAEAMPEVDLVAGATHYDSTDYVLGQRQDEARIGLELNVPIYAGGINSSRVRQAEAEAREAQHLAERLAIETERTVRQQFRQLESDYFQVRAFERAVQSAQAAQAATQAGYDAGTRTITDVLDAQSRLVQARRDLNQTRYNLLLHLLELRQSAGVVEDSHFAAVDSLFTQTQ
jgi:TolC family type I secretion outer membrane protein